MWWKKIEVWIQTLDLNTVMYAGSWENKELMLGDDWWIEVFGSVKTELILRVCPSKAVFSSWKKLKV